MAKRIAAASALVVFAVSILLGLRAQNSFSTTVSRALLAMVATFAVGLVVGGMAQKMAQENLGSNLSGARKKMENSPPETPMDDR